MAEAIVAPRRRSLAGPIVLIIIGLVFLLGNMRVITWRSIGIAFAKYWPVLIIIWGLVKLFEYYQARRANQEPSRIGAGGVLLLIFLVLLGISASTTYKLAPRIHAAAAQGEFEGEDGILALLGGQNFNYTAEQQQEFGNAATVRVESNRGAVSVITWDQPTIRVVAKKRVTAENEEEAKKLDASTQPTITRAGDTITVRANNTMQSQVVVFGSDIRYVRSDLEIYMPKKAALELTTRHGDVTVRDREGNVRVTNSHGDVTVEALTGSASVSIRHGNVRGNNVTGNFSVDGRVDDTTLTHIGGLVQLSGDFFGDMNLSKVAKGVQFRSSRTDMELARLDGDLRMGGGDLYATTVLGPVRLITKSKDIRLEQVTGDVRLQNSNGLVEVRTSKLGQLEIENRNGDVIVAVPQKAAFAYDVKARHGEINSEFGEMQTAGVKNENTTSGTIGSGGPRVAISATHGDISIRKTS